MGKKLKYISYGQTVDGTNYCSGVETLAENLIEDSEDDAVVVFPGIGEWATMRTSKYRLTTDNAEAQLPSNIYKLRRFLIYFGNELKYNYDDRAIIKPGYIKRLKYKDGSPVTFVDITNRVIDDVVSASLPLAPNNAIGVYMYGLYQDSTLKYKQGDSIIAMDATVREIKSNILDIAPDISPVYLRTVLAAIRDEAVNGNIIDGGRTNEPLDDADNAIDTLDRVTSIDGDVRKWKFRIEYVPISSRVKLRAIKSEKTNVDYIQPHNQRAETNAASAFGKNMWLEAQKTGVQTITVVKRYTKLADIPPVGALVLHNGKRYRLTANSYKQTNTIFLQVTHTLSENWTSKSKHVAVDQKYRNYSIPQETVWRNLHWQDFITVSGEKKNGITAAAGIKLRDVVQFFLKDNENDKTIDRFYWFFEAGEVDFEKLGVGVTCVCATYGIANSMVFSASFKDQLSAGLTMDVERGDNLCKEALYCNEDGTIEHATVILSDGAISEDILGTRTDEEIEAFAQKVYPVVVDGETPFAGAVWALKANYPKEKLFEKSFYIDKDPGEAIKFTYQIHFVTDGDCIVGNKLAEHHTLVKRYDGSRVFKVWLLPNYIRVGADKLDTTGGIDYTQDRFTPFVFFTVETDDNAGTAKIELSALVKQELTNYKAWAITDENGNLYVGRNENSAGVVYLTVSHNRL